MKTSTIDFSLVRGKTRHLWHVACLPALCLLDTYAWEVVFFFLLNQVYCLHATSIDHGGHSRTTWEVVELLHARQVSYGAYYCNY